MQLPVNRIEKRWVCKGFDNGIETYRCEVSRKFLAEEITATWTRDGSGSKIEEQTREVGEFFPPLFAEHEKELRERCERANRS